MHWKTIGVVAAVVAAIGQLLIAAIAIWGDLFRYKLSGPRLKLSLNDPRGSLVRGGGEKYTYYYHLKIANRRLWAPANDVRVRVEQVSRRGPDGVFVVEPIVYSPILVWTPSNLKDVQRKVSEIETCDLGFIGSDADKFTLSTIVAPANFDGHVRKSEAIRVLITASGQNIKSSKPLLLEIAWDGTWTSDKDSMQRHLVIKQIAAL